MLASPADAKVKFFNSGSQVATINANSGSSSLIFDSGSYTFNFINGNVGIGTANAAYNLSVVGSLFATNLYGDSSNLTNIMAETSLTANVALVANDVASGIIVNGDLAGGDYSSITTVGTLGNLNVSGTVTANAFVGNGAGLTNIDAGNISGIVTDNFANTVSINNTLKVSNLEVAPGTVVVIDKQNIGHLKVSTTPYDKKVVGVV